MRGSASTIREIHGAKPLGDLVWPIVERAHARLMGPHGDAERTAKVEALGAVIVQALADTGRAAPEREHVLAAASRLITADGALEEAIGCYFAVGSSPARTVLMDYQEALAEIADPMRRVRRMKADAVGALTMAERHAKTAEGHERTAKTRREQGENDLARDQELMASASRTCEERNRVRAAELAAQADQLERTISAGAGRKVA